MTDNNQVAEKLDKMIELLEAIDWKLWNFHQKVMGDAPEVGTSVEDEETEQLAAVIDTPKAKPAAEKKAGFPSVEKWS